MNKIFLLFFCLLVFIYMFPNTNTDYIIVIDVSQSMNEDNLFQKAKDDLVNFLSKNIAIGDRIILYSFDEFPRIIKDREIENTRDIDKLLLTIKQMKAKGMKTYITNAIDAATKRLIDIHKVKPDRSKYMLLITDGKNESQLTYDELINKYKTFLSSKGVQFDILSIGKIDSKLKNFCIKTNANYYVVERFNPKIEKKHLIENVIIEYNIKDHKIPAGKKGYVNIDFKIKGTITDSVMLELEIFNKTKQKTILDTILVVFVNGLDGSFKLPFYNQYVSKEEFIIIAKEYKNENPVIIKPEQYNFNIETFIPKPILSKKAVKSLIIISAIIIFFGIIIALLLYYNYLQNKIFNKYSIKFSNDSEEPLKLSGYKKFLSNEVQLKDIISVPDELNVCFKTDKKFFPSDLKVICKNTDVWNFPTEEEISTCIDGRMIEFESKKSENNNTITFKIVGGE